MSLADAPGQHGRNKPRVSSLHFRQPFSNLPNTFKKSYQNNRTEIETLDWILEEPLHINNTMKAFFLLISLLSVITIGCSQKKPQAKLPEGSSLHNLLAMYFTVQEAFAADNMVAVKTASISLTVLMNNQYKDLKVFDEILEAAEDIRGTDNIEVSRRSFQELSKIMIDLASANSDSLNIKVYVTHCPMAFDYEGADWLQKDDQINNPYEGSRMLTCGAVNAVLGSE